MPILLDGLQVPSVSFSSVPCSSLSSRFRTLLPSNAHISSLLVTTLAGHHNAISFPIAFQTADNASTDVILGPDWAAFLRDSLLGLGYRVDSTFSAWRFFTVLEPDRLRLHLVLYQLDLRYSRNLGCLHWTHHQLPDVIRTAVPL
ncbi:hypothetical protein B0H13DRAFT_2348888 [Mycena leptocephala]|nr:hypothetical protein B0H13DRAFT_2348888 [Mycena leptocephala]